MPNDPKPKTVTGELYADLIREGAGPAVLSLYPQGDGVWQDDTAKIHRCAAALEAVDETFNSRIPHDKQAPKMADCYPIENVWSIIKDKVKENDIQNLNQLKKVVTKAWKEINNNKTLCRKLMESMPKRFKAVIEKQGDQLRKEDCH